MAGREAQRMSKRKTAAPNRDRRVLVPLSAAEFQLVDYAASKSNIRGTLAWMRAKLLEAAKAKLSDEVVRDILEGRATMALMRESLSESKRMDLAQAEQPEPEEQTDSAPGDRATERSKPTKMRGRAKLKLVTNAETASKASRRAGESKPRSRR
jgi:hypothetical protein